MSSFVLFIAFYVGLSYLVVTLVESNKFSKIGKELTVCQDYSVLFNSSAKIVDVINGSTVNLLCRLCDRKNTYQKQTWYFKKQGLDVVKSKINYGTGNVYYILTCNDLQIRNFNSSLAGIYTCEYTDEYMEGGFTYVLDEVFDAKPKIGFIDEWRRYKREKLDKINEQFNLSKSEPFSSLRNRFKFSFELVTIWDDWGPCEPVEKRKGFRKRLARCRLRPIPFKVIKQTKRQLDRISRYFLLDPYEISCRSKKLNQMLPAVSRIVNLSDYQVIEACNVDELRKNYVENKIQYKYKVLKHVVENGHLNLICPEIETYSHIDWFKNNVLLNNTFRNNIAASEEEPHLTIDSYGTLYILHATKNEEASYSCVVDGEHLLFCDLRVVSKSRLLNQEFIRYSIYLGFVLSLTLTCYCAGIFVAWHRRASFVDPLHLNKQKARRRVKNKQLLN